ncbi:MAG: peptide chain release factor N(5)-glutamine methyltransferase [Gammaproteobacteria bacterium]
MTTTLSELRRLGRERLRATMAEDAATDTDHLLIDILGINRSRFISHPDAAISDDQVRTFDDAITRRLKGEPVAQITGRRGFWTLDLEVDANTLIPRPETEMLVSLTLEFGDQAKDLSLLDLCTGSGAVALAIASERPRWRITATELSEQALTIAEHNLERLKLDNLELKQGDLYQPVADQHFQIIVANPPYIPEQDPHLSQGDLRFEPRQALAAGEDGLDVLRPLIHRAPKFLEPGGLLLVEHGYDQREAVLRLADEAGLADVEDLDDLAGNPRVLRARQSL